MRAGFGLHHTTCSRPPLLLPAFVVALRLSATARADWLLSAVLGRPGRAAAGLRATAAVRALRERNVVAAAPRDDEAGVGSFSLLLPTGAAECALAALSTAWDSRARRASTSAVCDHEDGQGTAACK